MKTLPAIILGFACVCLALAGCNSGASETGSGAIEVGNCHVGGCSNEVCSDRSDAVSPCIFKREFACYKTAVCEPQQDGACGWTQTPELAACLARGGP